MAELETFKTKMAERESAIQNAAKKQIVDVESRCEELGQRLDAASKGLASVKRQAIDEHAALEKQLTKVQHGH